MAGHRQRNNQNRAIAARRKRAAKLRSLEAAVEEAGFGTLQFRVPLSVSSQEAKIQTWLCQTSKGVWIGSPKDSRFEATHDLVRDFDENVRYETVARGDRLIVHGTIFEIPIGSGKSVRAAIGLGRLLSGRDAGTHPIAPAARYVEGFEQLEEAWLSRTLVPGEILLAWLHTTTSLSIASRVVPQGTADARFLLTDRRSELVAISEFGDVRSDSLPDLPLSVTDEVGRDTVVAGMVTWTTTMANDGLHREIAECTGLQADGRTRRLAQLNWLRGGKSKTSAAAANSLLDPMIARGLATPLDRAARALLLDCATWKQQSGFPAESLATATSWIAALPRTEETAREAGRWFVDWEFSSWLGDELVDRLLAVKGDPSLAEWCIPLHQSVRQMLCKNNDEDLHVRGDLRLAGHLMRAGKPNDAIPVLEGLLSSAPLLDTEAHFLSTLSQGAQDIPLRIVVLEKLAEAAEAAGLSNTAFLTQLARLDPLNSARLATLAERAEGTIKKRAGDALRLLEPASLASPNEPGLLPRRIRPLDPEAVALLQHPAARQASIIAWLLRKIPTSADSESDLRSHAQRISADEQSSLSRAIGDAAMLLSVRSPGAFVSKGDQSLGIRAYDSSGDVSLFVGDQHLTPGSLCYLGQDELRFAIGSELAHVRLGHARLTSTDAWSAAIDTTAFVLTCVAWLFFRGDSKGAPKGALKAALKGVRSLGLPLRWLKRLKTVATIENLKSVVQTGKAAIKNRQEDKTTEAIAPDQEDLIKACRGLYWSADRAGLVLCGDLRAAVRAVFLTSRVTQSELAIADRNGLAAALERRDDAGILLWIDLAMRIACLFAFFLSDEYESLREAAAG